MKPKKTDKRGCPKGKGTVDVSELTGGEKPGLIGNPPHEVTEANRELVRTYAKVMSQEMIAAAFTPPVSVDTLQRHYRNELDLGKREAVAAVGGKLLAKALAGHPASMIFYLRTQGKWNTRVEVTGPDGKPIEHEHTDVMPLLRGLSDEQLAIIEPIFERIVSGELTGEQISGLVGAEPDQDAQS